MTKSTITRSFRSWPLPLRVLSVAVAGVLALTLVGASALVGYSTLLAPPLAKAQQARCHQQFESDGARDACVRGDIRSAKKAEAAHDAEVEHQALVDKCGAQYDDLIAQTDCVNGDTTQADADQKAADEAAAAAAKAASIGQTYDNPYRAGQQASMQSTNRLDGTTAQYLEWISGFNPNWTGYDEFEAPDAGKKYVSFVVHVQATTAGVDAGTVVYDASFTDAAGNVYDHADAEFQAKPQMPNVTLGAGQQASGVVVFEVPASVTNGVATFGGGTVFEAVR